MSTRNLMSVVDAAGYAMAPADEFVSMPLDFQPEIALRNGHVSAARVLRRPIGTPTIHTLLESISAWMRDMIGPWFGGRAAA